MGSSKDHKKKKEHKRHHKRKHKHSDSEERSPNNFKRKHKRSESEDRSPEAKRKKSEKDRKSRKHHKRQKYDDDKQRSLSPNEANGQNLEEVSIEEEEVVYVPQETAEDKCKEEIETMHITDGKSEESLSIEETNRLREKLGLKPLNVGKVDSSGDSAVKAEFVHAPAEDLWKKKKAAEIREKLQSRKEKRKIEQKMSKIKTLGEESDDESASNWVERSRIKEDITKKEKEFNQMAEEFGVGDLVKKEFKHKSNDYSEKDLKGLNVEHSLESFKEGRSQVLVIKDKEILASDDEDVLHSVTIQDQEKAKKNLDIKRRGFGYKAYEEEEVDEMGFFKHKSVLGKYDEEIEGEASTRFTIGEKGFVDTSWEQQKESMKQEIRAKGESLTLPPLRLASEYLTAEEMTFKKRKRKVKKTRKREMLKAEDLLPLPGDAGGGQDHGSRIKITPSEIPGLEDKVEILEDPEEEKDIVIKDEDDANEELERALAKSRKAKWKKISAGDDDGALQVVQHIETISKLDLEKPNEQFSTTISLNATDEFCRQLGAQSTSKINDPPIVDDKEEVDMEVDDDEDQEEVTQWSSVLPGEEKSERPTNIEAEEHAPIEAEPLAAGGLMGALKLAQRKGYLGEETKKGSSTVITNSNSHLQAKHYSIEDKNAVDYLDKYAHEKYTKDRSRHDRGIITEFTEKKDYKPKIQIEYVDDRGRVLCAKEAFRKLSHRFHGKGSGKSKQEKRMKKLMEEETMKHMSSTDTPLNTVAMMKSKLKNESSAYIVLSGAGKTLMSGGGDALSKK